MAILASFTTCWSKHSTLMITKWLEGADQHGDLGVLHHSTLLLPFIQRYSLLLSSLTALMSHATLNEQLYPFIVMVYQQRYLVVTWLVPCETAAVSVQVLYPPCNSLQCHIIQSHIGRVCVCLAVNCHLHFWQNNQDLLRYCMNEGMQQIPK